MNHYKESARHITDVLTDYFNGIFEGDVELLKNVFHPQALISGDVKGQKYFKTVDEYLEGVKKRKSPLESGETFGMEILAIEIINTTAIVKAHVPIFEFNYYDFLSLTIINGRWVIVNKLLTHVD